MGDQGQLLTTSGDDVSINGLCPSDQPGAVAGDWRFTYTIFDNQTCTAPENDSIICYDSRDLAAKNNPNASVEPLASGPNSNKIICIAETSGKDFEFLSCGDATTTADSAAGNTRYICGCTGVGPDDCDCNLVDPLDDSDFDACNFQTNCDIVCNASVFNFAAAGAALPGARQGSASVRPAAAGGACPDYLFASTHSGVGSALQTFDPDGHGFSPLGSPCQYDLEGLAYNPRDGYLYAISNTASGRGKSPHLLRIGRNQGDVSDLGEVAGLEGAQWSSGAFLRDGSYVIGGAGSAAGRQGRGQGQGQGRWAKLGVGQGQGARLINSGAVNGSLPASWAAHPHDGHLYGYVSGGLAEFDPEKGALRQGAKLTQIRAKNCIGAFRRTGELLLYCSGNTLGLNDLYSVDVSHGTSQLLSSGLQGDVGALTGCAFQ